MELVEQLLDTYGYWLFFAVGLAEYAGIPVAGSSILLIGGTAAATGNAHLFPLIAAAALGGLLADLIWYQVARWRGDRIVSGLCGLTSNPNACVLKVADRIRLIGARYIVPSKFIPGTGNLAAASAGLAGVRPLTFLATDSVALGLWASAYSGLGYLFAARIENLLVWLAGYGRVVILVAVSLILAATVWRTVRVRLHTGTRTTPGSYPAHATTLQPGTYGGNHVRIQGRNRRSARRAVG